jgi:hypothetical protein
MGTRLNDNRQNRISVGRSRHMSPYLTPSPERAVIHPDRRVLLQMALIAPFAVPYRARAAGAQSTALDPILTLNNGLLAVMKAGNSVSFL